MIEVMAALRKLVGITGAGFEMLQDFVDEIFQGILPATFVEKYASEGFQQSMESRYSKPTSKKEKTGTAFKNVPVNANTRPISRVAKARNAANQAAKKGTKAVLNLAQDIGGKIKKSPVGKFSGIITAAAMVWDAVDLVSDIVGSIGAAQRAQKLADMWPENFTLFDYGDIVNKFGDLESFLLEDSSCYTMYQYELMNKTMQMFPCFNSSLTQYTEAGSLAGTTSIDATQCWADAAPSLGQNSLFACSATSTCCETTACEDGKLIPCGTCPEPAQLQTNRFGCHSARRKCVCGTPRTVIDRCSANLHCDTESQCELVSSMGSMSYGSIPCKLCPAKSQVLCLLGTGGMPGGCACMLDTAVRYDTCSDLSGLETGVDSSKLCGYLHGQSPTSTDWSFDMENLMIVPCAQVATGVCSTVYNTGGNRMTTIRMVVAAKLRGARGTGRRLLQQEGGGEPVADNTPPTPHHDSYLNDQELLNEEGLHAMLMEHEGWGETAPPCRQLVVEYQAAKGPKGMGTLDRVELRRCGFWRFVGRRVLERHNLTHTTLGQRHETFLLSLDDLISAIMCTEGSGLTLLRNPGVFGSALLYHSWMRPMRALGVFIANRLEHLHWVREIDFDVHEALFGDGGTQPELKGESPKQAARQRLKKLVVQQQTESSEPSTPTKGRGRTLLSLAVVDTVKDVAQFSGQIIQGVPMTRGAVPSRVAGAWSSASFSWPPVYDYSKEACPLALSALEIGRRAVSVLAMYFQNFGKPQRPIDRSLRANLPSWPWIDTIRLKESDANSLPATTNRSWASWTFHKVLDITRVRPEHLVAFFTTDRKWGLQWILETAIKCDLASAVTCSNHDKDLVMSTVIFLLGYILIVRPVCNGLGMGFLPILYILSYPWFILWFAFGMAPSCFPMLPTCLLSDIITTMGMFVPPSIEFPENLRCDDPKGGAMNQTCLRECSELGFDGWEDPLVFSLCDTDPRTCQYLLSTMPAKSGVEWIDLLAWEPLRDAMMRFHPIVTRTDEVAVRHLAGYRLCTWVTWVTATPILALAALALVLGGALCMAVLDLIPSIIGFWGQMYMFYTSGG